MSRLLNDEKAFFSVSNGASRNRFSPCRLFDNLSAACNIQARWQTFEGLFGLYAGLNPNTLQVKHVNGSTFFLHFSVWGRLASVVVMYAVLASTSSEPLLFSNV